MYGQYLAAVIRRAFQPGARFTDILQILAASAAPAAAKFLGLRVPTPDETLAYIGAAAIAFVSLRLFFVAPYQVWREQLAEIGTLTLELSKPERRVLEHLAKHRAKARAKLASILEDCQTCAYAVKWEGYAEKRFVELMTTARQLQAEAGLSEAFNTGRQQFIVAVRAEADAEPGTPLGKESRRLADLLQQHLVGGLTAEDLALRLPPNTGSKTQQ